MFFIAVVLITTLTMAIIYSEPIGDEWKEDPWSSNN
jgi:hypothetical protein